MLTIRKSQERGHANHGWLNSFHTFSFANYYDRNHMGFRSLRVINEDRVAPNRGFGAHPHRDMEIISYVLEGALAHKDSMGNSSVIRPGEVQIMSAGGGVVHSEYNHSETSPVHFLQIWVVPNQQGLQPRYEQKMFSDAEKEGQLRLIVSPDGRDGSVTIDQDANIYATLLDTGQQVEYQVRPNRYAWVQVARGSIMLSDRLLQQGDGVAVSDASSLKLVGGERSEVLLFDLG